MRENSHRASAAGAPDWRHIASTAATTAGGWTSRPGAFRDRFARQFDREAILPERERQRRPECAAQAYCTALAAKSA